MNRVILQVLLLHFLLQSVHSRIPPPKTVSTPKPGQNKAGQPVQLTKPTPDKVVIDNGIVQVNFSNPQGLIIGIKYNGIDQVLDVKYEERGYWDVSWSEPKSKLLVDKVEATKFEIITQTPEQVEISFTRTWTVASKGKLVPLNVDKRYIIRSGVSGIHMYGILERLKGWPDIDMDQVRIVFKLNPTKFDFMVVDDYRQRSMPTMADRADAVCKPLAFKEAVLLANPKNPLFKGQVDDKYMYSLEDKDNNVQGWISANPPVGFWMITPSDEFRLGGPFKQELSSHAGPITLNMFTSIHYAGKEMRMDYRNGEPWKKVFGPVFAYLNTVNAPKDANAQLWADAKRQMTEETKSWPYSFVKSPDFPLAPQRGNIEGLLSVKDSHASKVNVDGKLSAYVGLAPIGEPGSWQTETKGYQFWAKTDEKGKFVIANVRAGTYNLFATVFGYIGDYKYAKEISITPGCKINVGPIVYEPPRIGPTLWEIGVPDRTAAEFFVPDPLPTLRNNISTNPKDRFRQYGLWDRYTDLYPKNDLIFTIGVSDHKKDWFFAHVSRKAGNAYKATTWQIKFSLKDVNKAGVYTLRIALASATDADIHVRVNNQASNPIFRTGSIGKDNAIARHGIHGLYKLFAINVAGNLLTVGDNTIFLTQTRCVGPFQGVMYDYLRLEAPKV